MRNAGREGRLLVTPQMAAVIALFASVPLWIEGVGLYPYLGVEIVIWIIYALGFNLLLGYGGLPSFGHGAFFGVGAYGFGLWQLHALQNLWLGLAAAIVAAAVAGGLVGLFVSHRRGIYFALLTIAFGQVFWFVANKWFAVTGGGEVVIEFSHAGGDLDMAAFDASGAQVAASESTSDRESVAVPAGGAVRVYGYAGATNGYRIVLP